MINHIISENKKNNKNGLICICSAHKDVIHASFQFLKNNPLAYLSIESTVQQVNQDGGYTGMKPKDFSDQVRKIASEYGVSDDSFVLAGDHLGPNVWKHLPSQEAMAKSLVLVREYVKAGYKKLHIDPSMSCQDDIVPLPVSIIAERTALLIEEAEKTALEEFGTTESLFYIVGTEVPIPGGSQEHEDHINITPKEEVEQTIHLIKNSLSQYGIDHVWKRIHGIVVQPGVEFGDDFVFRYQEGQANHLNQAIQTDKHIVFEAHSTDYQTTKSLSALVHDHFAILKVGPELTFAWREALYALDMIESQNPYITQKSNIRSFVEEQMLNTPNYWQPYYTGTEEECSYKRVYSLSDRIRYYWNMPKIEQKLQDSMKSLENSITYSLVSQYLPWVLEFNEKYNKSNFSAQQILRWSVERVIQKYYNAITK